MKWQNRPGMALPWCSVRPRWRWRPAASWWRWSFQPARPSAVLCSCDICRPGSQRRWRSIAAGWDPHCHAEKLYQVKPSHATLKNRLEVMNKKSVEQFWIWNCACSETFLNVLNKINKKGKWLLTCFLSTNINICKMTLRGEQVVSLLIQSDLLPSLFTFKQM